MTITSESVGITVNNARRLEAENHIADGHKIYDSTCSNGIGVSTRGALIPLMSVDFQEQELSGVYNIRAYWKSSEFDAQDLILNVYADGTLEGTLSEASGGDYLTVGSSFVYLFYPNTAYTIEVTSGTESANTVVTLDYIQLDQIYSHGVISSLLYTYGTDGPALEVTDRGTATVVGTGAATANTAVTFNVTFSTPPQVELTSNSHLHNPSWHSKTNTGVTVRLVDMNLGTFSDTVDVDWVAHGSVLPPFNPRGHDYGTP